MRMCYGCVPPPCEQRGALPPSGTRPAWKAAPSWQTWGDKQVACTAAGVGGCPASCQSSFAYLLHASKCFPYVLHARHSLDMVAGARRASSDCGQLALRRRRLPQRRRRTPLAASGCPKPRPASTSLDQPRPASAEPAAAAALARPRRAWFRHGGGRRRTAGVPARPPCGAPQRALRGAQHYRSGGASRSRSARLVKVGVGVGVGVRGRGRGRGEGEGQGWG